MAVNFLLNLLAGAAESVEMAGIEQALEDTFVANPAKYQQHITILSAAAGVIKEMQSTTKSGLLQKLEEGFVTAIEDSLKKHPLHA